MRRFLSILLVVMSIAAPAAADETSGAEETTPIADLTAEARAEIDLYSAAEHLVPRNLPLPGGALKARIATRMLRADAFLGYLRSRAHDTLHATLPDDVVHVVHDFDSSYDTAAISAALDASAVPSASVWAAEDVADDWIAFQAAIEELREVTRSGSPERVCPVDGYTHFRNEWEYPRPWGRIHKGVDMHAALGTPLVAVEDGVVIQANWHYLGGRQVYFQADSTGDVYYYAHLGYWPRWLWTGTRLNAGDYLGDAGYSGNAVTSHLHLGWMPGSRSVELDNLQNSYFLMYELCL
jgi:murein DD-endopeptidase MepM/ murein hydrolase activator NlpD